MDDAVIERVEALERAVTDGENDLSSLAEDAQALERLETLENRCEEFEARIAELEAATQALRGYVGNVRAVNEEVETRAEAALAKAEALEEVVPQEPSDHNEMAGGTNSTQDQVSSTPSSPPHGTADGTRLRRTVTDDSDAPREPGTAVGDAKSSADTGHGRSQCNACGRAHRENESGPVGDTGDGSDVGSSADRTERWGDSTEAVGQSDPLVSDGAEKDCGALGRFKRLL